ncbi:sugar O-acetyltransferase [Secundilactobacillus similis]|uniref:Acetyltransferase n=1 Tax=Secundilactobacillus similis DSM 23365 = JCM 2765 TaxID=1423804 RepID=A0A0R2FE48_9LACO|nr:sugar O-acetyltransferase [Secundilactobacillus similis]KRN26831.1 maltose O-acetyltransferase [Secundilactobacillus similis DSM 23365 = JCM 2765]
MTTEQERMLAGEMYNSMDADLVAQRESAHNDCLAYNQLPEAAETERQTLVDHLMPNHGEGCYLQGPVQFDYGRYITVGDNFYANFNFTVLDEAPITVGNNVMCGPNVTLVTALHPLRYQQRNMKTKDRDGEDYSYEHALPITIGDNCWLASNVTVIGGVTIGSGCVIGAGSVVVKDIPANSLAVGNPCRVVREITEADQLGADGMPR